MKEKCEQLFVDLVSPYLTALAQARKELELLEEMEGKLKGIIDKVCVCQAGGEIIEGYTEGKFPKQDKSLRTIHGITGKFPLITQVHDDGDLTVDADGKKYVVTTDGSMFAEEKT
jgi:hypothetical protein